MRPDDGPDPNEVNVTIETWDPSTLAERMAAGAVLLIDVREAAEYAAERIPGALLYPLSSFDAAALPDDSARAVVFHCAGGKRSLDAAQRRIAAGATQARHLGGGLAAWKAAGLPLIRG